jgi:hypothetical protein
LTVTDKWGRRLFRTGAIALFLLGGAHSLSLVEKPVPANDTEKQLIALTTNYKFNLMGSMRSFDTLFRGFSISFVLAMFVVGSLCLALAGESVQLLKKVAAVNALWLAAMTAVSLHYFFPAPTAFLIVALLLFAASC